MSCYNFNVRDIPPDVMAELKKEAKRLQTSVNALILKLIRSGLGVASEIIRPVYSDLDYLSGSWTAGEAKKFQERTKTFEQIDKDLWP